MGGGNIVGVRAVEEVGVKDRGGSFCVRCKGRDDGGAECQLSGRGEVHVGDVRQKFCGE